MADAPTRCPCGWPLPANASALRATTREEILDSVVLVRCPTCGISHAFAHAEIAAALATLPRVPRE